MTGETWDCGCDCDGFDVFPAPGAAGAEADAPAVFPAAVGVAPADDAVPVGEPFPLLDNRAWGARDLDQHNPHYLSNSSGSRTKEYESSHTKCGVMKSSNVNSHITLEPPNIPTPILPNPAPPNGPLLKYSAKSGYRLSVRSPGNI